MLIRFNVKNFLSFSERIVDRDKESFVSKTEDNQYDDVLKTCAKKNFGLFVTNPCFEFWLLLHFDEVFQLDQKKLIENPKVAAKKRYTEQKLCEIWPGYKKNSYRATELVKIIDKAIVNEKKFCEDAAALEHKVGSNIGILLEILRRKEPG